MRAATPIVAVLVVLAAAPGTALAGRVRTLVTSGTTVDGFGIQAFSRLGVLGGKTLVFRGVASAAVLEEGGVRRVIAASGDPLPAPLGGTFNNVRNVATHPSGLMGLVADLNSRDGERAIFLVDNGLPVPLVVDDDSDATPIGGRFALNAHGDTAFLEGDLVRRFVRATGATTDVAPLVGSSRLGTIAIDAARAVAWHLNGRRADEIGSVSYWSEQEGAVVVAEEDQAGPLGPYRELRNNRTDIALDAAVGLAFVARTDGSSGAFVYSPGTGMTDVVAQAGDLVGAEAIFRVTPPVVIDTDGSLLFGALLGAARRDAIVRARGGVLAEDVLPAAPLFDVEQSEAVFKLAGRRVTPLVRTGDPIPGGGTIAGIEMLAAGRGGLAFRAPLDDGRLVLAHWRRGRLSLVATDGEATATGPLDLTELGSLAVDKDTVALLARAGGPAALAWRDGALAVLPAPPLPDGGSTWTPQAVAVARGRTLVQGLVTPSLSPVAYEIYTTDGTALETLAVTGQSTVGKEPVVLGVVGAPVAEGRRRTVFAGEDAAAAPGIGLVTKKGVRWFPTADTTGPLAPVALDLAGPRIAFTAVRPAEPDLPPGVFALRRGRVVPVLRDGDATPAGTVELTGAGVAAVGRTVVFDAGLEGGDARAALLSVRPGR